MGVPSSSLFSEIYLQHIENTKMFAILLEHFIVGYFGYFNYILIVNKNHTTKIYHVLNLFNNIMSTMKFTMEERKDIKINFQDITLSKDENNISFNIYRKQMTTDTVIPSDSCHPQEHKFAEKKISN